MTKFIKKRDLIYIKSSFLYQCLSKTDTYSAASLATLQTKTTEAQTLYNDTTIHPASEYTTKKNELQSAIDGLVNIIILSRGIEAAQKTLNFVPYSDNHLKSDSTTTDEWFEKWYNRTKESSRTLINNLQIAKNNAQTLYNNRSISTATEDPSIIFTVIRQNLLTLIDKAERHLVVYTGGSPGAWTQASRAPVESAITKAKEIINRPSDDLNEYLSTAEMIHTSVAGLEYDNLNVYDP